MTSGTDSQPAIQEDSPPAIQEGGPPGQGAVEADGETIEDALHRAAESAGGADQVEHVKAVARIQLVRIAVGRPTAKA